MQHFFFIEINYLFIFRNRNSPVARHGKAESEDFNPSCDTSCNLQPKVPVSRDVYKVEVPSSATPSTGSTEKADRLLEAILRTSVKKEPTKCTRSPISVLGIKFDDKGRTSENDLIASDWGSEDQILDGCLPEKSQDVSVREVSLPDSLYKSSLKRQEGRKQTNRLSLDTKSEPSCSECVETSGAHNVALSKHDCCEKAVKPSLSMCDASSIACTKEKFNQHVPSSGNVGQSDQPMPIACGEYVQHKDEHKAVRKEESVFNRGFSRIKQIFKKDLELPVESSEVSFDSLL